MLQMDENDSSWNPFLDAPFEIISNNANSIMDDRSFGVCFDGLPRGYSFNPKFSLKFLSRKLLLFF